MGDIITFCQGLRLTKDINSGAEVGDKKSIAMSAYIALLFHKNAKYKHPVDYWSRSKLITMASGERGWYTINWYISSFIFFQ